MKQTKISLMGKSSLASLLSIAFISFGCLMNNDIPLVTAFTYSSRPSISTSFKGFRLNNDRCRLHHLIKSQITRTASSQTDQSHKTDHNPVHIYKDYIKRLWEDTSAEARRRITKDKARVAVQQVHEIFKADNKYLDYLTESSLDSISAREDVVESCRKMLDILDKNNGIKSDVTVVNTDKERNGHYIEKDVSVQGHVKQINIESSKIKLTDKGKDSKSVIKQVQSSVTKPDKKKKSGRSILFGAAMGGVVACWVFSGNYIFTGLFTLMTALGQLEYYRMVMNAGIYPARKISVVGACAMFVTALFAPYQHQIVLPVFATLAMMWFLTMRRQTSSIADIATTFTGMFYLGYIPSFWVRTRTIGAIRTPTRLATIVKPMLDTIQGIAGKEFIPRIIPNSIYLPITTGSVFIFWSWLCIAFSDVGAYFAGRKFGKTKLGQISPAAGATSPNKTVEGVIGGCAISAILAALGAWVMKWPLWFIVGPIHGINLALLGLVGDLTASMLKRDAGLKDFGDLIPDHGGIMDRVDSFIFNAPYSWLVCAYFIPWLKTMVA